MPDFQFDKTTTDENIGFFENYCESAGISYAPPPDSIHENIIASFAGSIKSYRDLTNTKENFPEIFIGFYTDPVENAFARKWGDFYIIGISTGLASKFIMAIDGMLKHPECFEDIPDNEKALLFHQLLFSFYNFIFEHEFSHIASGHIDLLSQLDGMPAVISEKNIRVETSTKANAIRQVLEMDADMGAMSRLLATSKAAVENPMVDFSHISWHPFNSIELSWSDIYFSAACIFKMMGDGNYTDTDLGKSTHPDNRVRQLYCASILGQINKEYGFGISEKSVEDIVTNAFNKAESYCNCALEMKTNTDVFRREYFRQHPILKQMKELWRDDVYDSLEPLAYMPIVGPNGEPIPLDAPKT